MKIRKMRKEDKEKILLALLKEAYRTSAYYDLYEEEGLGENGVKKEWYEGQCNEAWEIYHEIKLLLEEM